MGLHFDSAGAHNYLKSGQLSSPPGKYRSKTMPNLQDHDMDKNLIHTVNSNYYAVSTFPQIQKARDSLSVFIQI